MFKLNEAADLEKAGHSLGQYFVKQIDDLTKTHAHHAALAAHHDAMKAAHSEYAAHHKATGDGMDDSHEMKQHMAKGHTHHTQMAAHHEALSKAHASHADTLKSQIDAMKTVASEWGGTVKTVGTGGPSVAELTKGAGLDERLQAVTDAMMTKAIESLDKNPAIGDAIERIVLDQIQKRIGGKLVPDDVKIINPRPQLTAVPRSGAPEVKTSTVPLEFQKLVAVETDE